MSDLPKRFSDEKLVELYEEIKANEKKESKVASQLLDCQNDLKHAIESLSKSVNDNKKSIGMLSADTRDLIDTWNDAQSTVRVMTALGRALKWLSGLAVIGFAFREVAEYYSKSG